MKERNIWQRIWDWIRGIQEFEVTIYFPANKVTKDDGTEVVEYNPKTYTCSKVKVVSETEFKLVTVDRRSVHIKTVVPVGYDIVKTK